MLFFIFAALIVLLDQLFKYWITVSVDPGGQIELIEGVIRITNVKNSGAAFGLFPDTRWVLVAISGVCIVVIAVTIIYYKGSPWGKLGLAGVLGGAVGNFIDRLALGSVIDMFEPEFVNFAIFNIADIFITLGGLLLCISLLFRSSADAPIRSEDGFERELSDHTEPGDYAVRVSAPVIPYNFAVDDGDWPDVVDVGSDEGSFTVESILEDYYTERLMSEYDDGGEAG
ncbi:MAG: signal peptidase II [Oscillospiraceae bacterium]|jgi:signal peptidase II|nr:signal peptidase II [Oscillospiraceae bacterium]